MKTQSPARLFGKAALALLFFLAVAIPAPVRAQGTAFSYQGQLNNNGATANGNYDFTFSLYTNVTTGTVVVGPITNAAVAVSNGVFTVTVDFGPGVFNSTTYWLGVAVRTNGNGAFVTLTNRQAVLSVPYAVYSSNSFSAATAGVAKFVEDGGVTASSITSGQVVKSLDGLHDAVNLAAGANITLATNGNTLTVSGSGGGSGWSLTGNAGTSPGVNYIGTTDNQAWEVHVNNQRGLRIEPDPLGYSPSVIAGGLANSDSLSTEVVIGGGYGNTITHGTNVVIGGGYGNQIQSTYDSTIGGGAGNLISIMASTIGGGTSNVISSGSLYGASFIGGGENNNIENNSAYSVIAGGYLNDIQPVVIYSVIGGGTANTNSAPDSTIGGGGHNLINSQYSTVGGGYNNSITGYLSPYSGIFAGEFNEIDEHTTGGTIAGGQGNWLKMYAAYSTIGGGESNSIDKSIAAVGGSVIAGGGFNSIASSTIGYCTISGGVSNQMYFSADYGVIAGGKGNYIGLGGVDDHSYSVIGGGSSNSIANNSEFSTIGGGDQNYSVGLYETIGGGQNNTNQSEYSTIGGGQENSIAVNTLNSTIGGGQENEVAAGGTASTIAGGNNNTASGIEAAIGGGGANIASGIYSTVPGGVNNAASGQGSVAMGGYAVAAHNGAFVWNDYTYSAQFSSTAPGQFLIHSSGGVGINTTATSAAALSVIGGISSDELLVSNSAVFLDDVTMEGGLSVDGVLNAGSYDGGSLTVKGNIQLTTAGSITTAGTICGTFCQGSDRNIKENFSDIDERQILDQVIGLPVTRWNYTNETAAISHIGPMAQDFTAAFRVGKDDKHITTIDEGGIALAAIKGLNQKLETELQTKNSQIQNLSEKNAALEKKLNDLTELVKGLAAAK